MSVTKEILQYQRDALESYRNVSRLRESMESYRQEIESVGMSTGIAEALEQAYPGIITSKARLNAFTRYPSQVNVSVGLEAISSVKTKGMKALIYGLIAAAIAAAAAIVGYLVKLYRGREADHRRARAADPRIFRIDPTTVGRSHPEWRDDSNYRAAAANFKNHLTKLLLELGAGRYNQFIKTSFSTQPAGIVSMLGKEINEGIISINETITKVKGKTTGATVMDFSDIEDMVGRLQDELSSRWRLIMSTPLPGTPPRGNLDERIENLLDSVTLDFTTTGLDKNPLDYELYEYGMAVTSAEKALDTINYEKLTKQVADLGKALNEQQRQMDAKLTNLNESSLELFTDALFTLYEYVNIQNNLLNIFISFTDSVVAAELAFCDLLRAQLEAMRNCGVNFEDDPKDRHFYKVATDYLNK